MSFPGGDRNKEERDRARWNISTDMSELRSDSALGRGEASKVSHGFCWTTAGLLIYYIYVLNLKHMSLENSGAFLELCPIPPGLGFNL